ncbi:MAG: hypothetical protein Fur0041_04790 [Bacteroidia bacterium]
MKHPFTLLVTGICAVLLLPTLFMDGMFMDGLLYASVAKNYAEGIGTFWEPVFSVTRYNPFHEQPPLMFFLQGIFFKIFGDGFYTERIYCLIFAILSCYFIYRIWQVVFPQSNSSALPVLLFFIMPVTFWSYTNNVEECSMVLFVLIAAFFQSVAFFQNKQIFRSLLISGLFILLAGLTKGVQGMFLLAGPFFWWLASRRISFAAMMLQSAAVLAVPLIFVVWAYYAEAPHNSFAAYFESRYVKTFNGVHATTGSHFHHLYELLQNSLPCLGIIVIASFSYGIQQSKARIAGDKTALLFFLFVGLSGILPLMVTLEQRGFYQLTAMPFIALFLAILAKPAFETLSEKLSGNKRWGAAVSYAGVFLIAGSIIATTLLYGKPKRDADKIHDLKLIADKTSTEKQIVFEYDIAAEWPLITYAQRFRNISVLVEQSGKGKYMIAVKGKQVSAGWSEVALPTLSYTLYYRH